MKNFTHYIGMILLVSTVAFASQWEHEKFEGEYADLTLEAYATEIVTSNTLEQSEKAEAELEQEKAKEIQAKIDEVEARIDATVKEKYTILQITEEDVIAAENELKEIQSNLSLLRGLSEKELMSRKSELADATERMSALKDKPVSYLWRVRDQIFPVERILAQVQDMMPSLLAEYVVQKKYGKRDCLYRIAGQDLVYEDVSKWPEIYRANKTMIDRGYDRYQKYSADPKYDRAQDLIFPGQVLSIPR